MTSYIILSISFVWISNHRATINCVRCQVQFKQKKGAAPPFFVNPIIKKRPRNITRTSPKSIPVSILLVRTVHIHTDVIRLLNS